MAASIPTVVECFAGAGMFRLGLGDTWRVVFANDISPMKAQVYRDNFGSDHLSVCDIAHVQSRDVPGEITLMHGSPPCVDVSLAGKGAGLSARRSGAFWPWFRLVRELSREGRGPRIVSMENVTGLLDSNGGRDFRTVIDVFRDEGYRVGPMLLDAAWWLPQSRPRLVMIAVRPDLATASPNLLSSAPNPFAHPRRLLRAIDRFPGELQAQLLWWALSAPPPRNIQLVDLIEREPVGLDWHDEPYTQRLIDQMSIINRSKLSAAAHRQGRVVGAVFRRTRATEDGGKAQRAEVRFDLAGCLRVATGGSSRQILLIIEDGRPRSRLLSGREAARLMGLPDTFRLPTALNDALSVAGDGIAVPMVRHVSEHLLEPLAIASAALSRHVA